MPKWLRRLWFKITGIPDYDRFVNIDTLWLDEDNPENPEFWKRKQDDS